MDVKTTSTNPSTLSKPTPSPNPPTSDKPSRILVKTTLPLLGIDVLAKPIISERLIIRPFAVSDFLAFHSLHIQPEPMALGFFGGCQPSSDLCKSFRQFTQVLRPWDSGLFFAILTRKPDGEEEDDYIGEFTLFAGDNWPVISFKFKKETWGNGYATEALNAFAQFWWSLPRATHHYRIKPDEMIKNTQIAPIDQPEALEILRAEIEPFNRASQRVLEKVGFEKYGEEDHENNIKSVKFRLLRPQSSIQSIRGEFK
ncbi:GNAT domain-containing protein [Xylaria scruposa]|nr:GNAT domain-containing protein [Xylaria scruposa]